MSGGDAGYRGIGKRPAHQDRKVAWHVAWGQARPGQEGSQGATGEAAGVVQGQGEGQGGTPAFYGKQVSGHSRIRARPWEKEHGLALLLGFANWNLPVPSL